MTELVVQIGKKGLNENLIENLKKFFKTRESIKARILKSACRDKEEARKMADELVDKLGKNYTYRLVGYTLALRKWRKPQRE